RTRHLRTSPLFPYTTLFRSLHAIGNYPVVPPEEPAACPGGRLRYGDAHVQPVEHAAGAQQGGDAVREPMLVVGVKRCHQRERRRSEEHTSELQSLAYLVCRL